MPSPFPGMDPYLEGSLWMTVHTQLSAEIARQLAPKLRPKYLALTTERFVYEAPEDIAIARSNLHPDVGVSRTGLKRPSSAEATVAEPPLRMATTIPTAIQHVTIEIRDAANRQLVTAIEVRSPTNKRGDGCDEYLAKRRKILLSTSHLVEVDLLRSGKRVPMQQQLPAASYFVFVSRAEHRPLLDVWPIGLTGRLPTIPIPLLPGDADVFLDLQMLYRMFMIFWDMISRSTTNIPPRYHSNQKRPHGPRHNFVRGRCGNAQCRIGKSECLGRSC